MAQLIRSNTTENEESEFEWRKSAEFLSLYRDIFKYIGEMNMTPVSLGDIPDTLQKLEDTYIIKFDTKARVFYLKGSEAIDIKKSTNLELEAPDWFIKNRHVSL